MKCQRTECVSDRIAHLHMKHSDCFEMTVKGKDCSDNGYAPAMPGLCSGDYTQFAVCLDCGQVQSKWPKATPQVSR